jgi:hypothetical protein
MMIDVIPQIAANGNDIDLQLSPTEIPPDLELQRPIHRKGSDPK